MVQGIGTRLFVSRLSFFTTDSHLRNLFSPFGIITEAFLVMDPKTQRPKGFGFVSYESEIEAEKAMNAMNGRIIDGRLIFVEPAKASRPNNDA
ncbi:organelle RRM domain-containing protein 6, chloroplastic-like [Prosopis cineraria]|uniref:organelle RRM domain-containing protein 6, chloroplastic-like n=1 Tax=Prosopis cineraria TaxID=364024 RepID=UPI0024100951|nr:organelle RRM domain-containing protein 6, chloroplastic-like [Prosopis cineraria]